MPDALETAGSRDHQDELRDEVSRIVGPERLKAMRKVLPRETFKDALIIYAVLTAAIGSTCLLHAYGGPLLTLACSPLLALLTGIAFNWINVQIHEASHRLLLRNKQHNDLYCDWVLGSFALQDVQTYRTTHGMHHAYLHTARDPDRWIYTSHMGSRQAMVRGLLEALTLRSLFQRKRQVSEILATQRRDSTSKLKSPHTLISKLLAQVLVMSIFVAAAGAWGVIYYGAIYLYGLLGVFTALVRIRTIVQHYHDSQLASSASDLSLFTSRTTVSSFLQHVVLGARMDYHFEHHLFPHIPYYALRELHALLHEAGFFNAIKARTGQQLRTEDFVASFGSLTIRPGA